MNINDFSKELRDKLHLNPTFRPFVCEGNPLSCEIFIIGFNPATEMARSFIDDWDDDYGFHKSTWMDHYISERGSKPLSSGKKKRNKVSNTRSRIEWITESLSESKIMETNLYSKATKSAKDLNQIDRDIDLFKFLLSSIKPKVLFLHGVEVRQEIEKLFNFKLVEDTFTQQEIFGNTVTIISKKHLSRGWSKEYAINFANELRQYI